MPKLYTVPRVKLAKVGDYPVHQGYGKFTEDDIRIEFTGLRPGEKLYEEWLADGETTQPTRHPRLRVARQGEPDALDLDALLRWVDGLGPAPASAVLRERVPEYHPLLY